MVLTYAPGVLVCWAQLLTRRPALRLWGWVKTWMDMRKQLGLLALFGEWGSQPSNANPGTGTGANKPSCFEVA